MPLQECPRCGRCEDAGVRVCPADGAELRAAPWPRTIAGRYRIEQLLGRGGMGAVYRAGDLTRNRDVAVKVVAPERLARPEALQRFDRDALILRALRHPSIVEMLDHGVLPDGAGFLVMELVAGEDLRRALLREGRVDAPRAAAILTSVCGGVEAAHREGVLHGDLKPENVLLPGKGDAKVVDFGVAGLAADARPHGDGLAVAAAVFVGTPAYMAPEQFVGAAPDARTDVYSLGVIAFEMLSGDLPYGRGTAADVALAQSRGVPALRAEVSPAVARAVRAALDRDADRRPGTPQAFAHLLNAAL